MTPTAQCACDHSRRQHFAINGKCAHCSCATFTLRRRGTTNSNARGSSQDRAARRAYLLRAYESDQGPGTARCYRCGCVLNDSTITVDRINPGCRGGRYVRSNIRPACGGCNSETGGRTRGTR